MKNRLKQRWLLIVLLAGLAAMTLIWGCEWRIRSVGKERCLDEIESLPDAPVAVGWVPRQGWRTVG
jgi:hypothetical protein